MTAHVHDAPNVPELSKAAAGIYTQQWYALHMTPNALAAPSPCPATAGASALQQLDASGHPQAAADAAAVAAAARTLLYPAPAAAASAGPAGNPCWVTYAGHYHAKGCVVLHAATAAAPKIALETAAF